MIGSVEVSRDKAMSRAILHENKTWSYEGDRELTEYLRTAVSGLDDDYAGPSEGPYGVLLLHVLARRVGGKARIEAKKPAPSGVAH